MEHALLRSNLYPTLLCGTAWMRNALHLRCTRLRNESLELTLTQALHHLLYPSLVNDFIYISARLALKENSMAFQAKPNVRCTHPKGCRLHWRAK